MQAYNFQETIPRWLETTFQARQHFVARDVEASDPKQITLHDSAGQVVSHYDSLEVALNARAE